MGEIEQKVKIAIRKTKINKAIIGTLAVAGGIGLAAVAPNVFGALGKLGILTPQNKQNIERSLARLHKHGYVTVMRSTKGKEVSLTKKGQHFAALLGEGKLALKKPKRWDGKWRVLIFDISSRKVRNQTRLTLVQLGFYRLQDSVWVYPHECEDLILLFKTDFHITKDLLYIVADHIEHDKHLRLHFGLTS